MKQTIDLMYTIAIPAIKEKIVRESEWLERLQNDNTAATIIEYRAEDHQFSEEELKLDEACETYFELYTQYMDMQLKCDRLQSNFTGDHYNVKLVIASETDENIEPSEEDLEDVELISDEEILKTANECDNL